MNIDRLPTLAALVVVLTVCASCASNPPTAAIAPPPLLWRIAQPPAQEVPTAEALAGDKTTAEAQATEYFGAQPEKQAAPGQKNKVMIDGKRIDLNFQDAEVRGVIDAILGDILKVNYTVAPQIQGRLTLRTGRPVANTALLSILETALLAVSATMIEQDGTWNVIPLDSAPQRIRGARRLDYSRLATPGYAIEIVPLRYVSAREMQKVLESFAPKGSVLQADDAHNHLALAGTSQERSSMMRTIDAFDVDWMIGTLFAVYHLDQVSPEQLVAELKQVFQPPLELMGSRVRVIPLERMQAVLGVARNKSDLELLEGWVRRLDVSSKTGGRKLYVYNVQNGNAKALAASLQLVLTGEISGGRSRAKLAPPEGTPAATNETGMGVATPASTANESSGSSAGNVSRIVSNDENNSLMILGTEDEYRLVRDALSKLDVLPRQVMIEAILAEVSLNDSLRYGVQWFFNSSANSFTFSSSDTGAVNSQFPGFSYAYTGWSDARLIINALQSRTDVKILSAPKLAVLNNQKATLQVGDEVPILTQVSQSTLTATTAIVSSIQMRETGVILEVTPRVNDNGNVILDVVQEVSEVTPTTSSGIDSPTIQRRRLRTIVVTRDGATVAMGGLIRETSTRGNSGVPILKDIPLLGNLFRTNTSDAKRTELVVLLVPHVMRNHEETESVVDSLIGSMNAAAELASQAAAIVPRASP